MGYDFHPGSIEEAKAHAETHGVSDNTRFEVAQAKDYPPCSAKLSIRAT